jgi:hypothetical protein
MTDEQSLMPCPNPWCQESRPIVHRVPSAWIVSCQCGAKGPRAAGREEAITVWNTRTPSDHEKLVGELVEALEVALLTLKIEGVCGGECFPCDDANRLIARAKSPARQVVETQGRGS